MCRPWPAPHPALPVMISPPVHSLLNRLCKVRLWLFYLPFEFLQQYVERETTTPLNSPAYLLLFVSLFVCFCHGNFATTQLIFSFLHVFMPFSSFLVLLSLLFSPPLLFPFLLLLLLSKTTATLISYTVCSLQVGTTNAFVYCICSLQMLDVVVCTQHT